MMQTAKIIKIKGDGNLAHSPRKKTKVRSRSWGLLFFLCLIAFFAGYFLAVSEIRFW